MFVHWCDTAADFRSINRGRITYCSISAYPHLFHILYRYTCRYVVLEGYSNKFNSMDSWDFLLFFNELYIVRLVFVYSSGFQNKNYAESYLRRHMVEWEYIG